MPQSKKNNNFAKIIIALVAVFIVLTVIIGTGNGKKPNEKPAAKPSKKPSSQQVDAPAVPEKVTKIASAKVGSAGDILVHVPIFESAYNSSTGQYDFSNVFSKVSPVIKGCDYFVANLEVTLAGSSRPYSGYPTFNCPDGIVDSSKAAGIDCLLTANNHCFDTRKDGLLRTQNVIKEKGLDYTGSRLNENGKKYIVKNVNGISFGFICYTYETPTETSGRKALNGILVSEDAQNLINTFNYDKLGAFYTELEGQLSQMKKDGAEVLTVYIHWGDEYNLTGNSYQREIAQKLCDMGVDVIVGGHPHVVEPMALLTSSDGKKQTVCLYSVGNFVSNQRKEIMGLNTGHTEDGLIFTVSASKYSDGTVLVDGIEAIPTWVNLHTENGKKVYTIVPLNKTGLTANEQASFDRTQKIIGDGYSDCLDFVKKNAESAPDKSA